MIRSLSLAAVVLVATTASPAFAGKAEDAFLSKFAGAYSGTGTLSGSRSGKVACTLVIRPRSSGVSYRGKCDIDQYGPQSFSGDIAYNDATGRYEATSPMGSTTPGVKSGSSLSFSARLQGLATGTSVMKLSGRHVVVDATIDDPDSGQPIKSHIDMKR